MSESSLAIDIAENIPEREQNSPSKSKTKQGEKNRKLGRRGEEAAASFLYQRGYEIIERNWKCPCGEADIIALDDNVLVFVEVKTRTNCNKGFPAEAVTPQRQQKYEKIACFYIKDCELVDVSVRFDVVSVVVLEPDRAFIRHHIGAYSVLS